MPLNILMPRGVELDGSHALVANGYGGYGVNIEPRFRPLNDVYLRNGVIYVIANLRGGAELGEAWHEGGSLVNKQNVFDDFAAVLTFLVDNGYTSRERLGIIGGSNGGLLMGATMTQHPELVRAVVSFVGIYDMLRVELSPNGAFNVTEFGTVTNEDHFRALHAYSPYHNVRSGVSYPATLFLTGANDPRVEPWHSRKMTARLQAAQAGEAPILLRTSDTSGHGIGTALSEEIEEYTDVFAFLFAQLGVEPRGGD
ncbi:MAG: prolyl oligopeptidase family serine peptidase [Sandaracinaceae bacterium]|nr:prolyl oligopeptidase family serine peptidase [Sandaracinaceae bacterium]